MATCDYPSELADRIAYPAVERQGSRTASRVAASPTKSERQLSVGSNLQGEVVGDIFYFIEPRPRSAWATVRGLVLLSLLLLAAIILPMYQTDTLPPRQRVTPLYLQPPPAAIGNANATKFEPPKVASTHIPTKTGISAPVHKTEKALPPQAGTPGGVAGGVPGGIVGGVPGGVFGEALNSAPGVPVLAQSAAPAPVKRVRIASRVAEANLIHDVPPQYPTEAGRGRIEGTVVLMAVIGTDGSVKDVRVESGLPILAQAAIEAVRQWRYKPYTVEGKPAEMESRITINFTLSAS